MRRDCNIQSYQLAIVPPIIAINIKFLLKMLMHCSVVIGNKIINKLENIVLLKFPVCSIFTRARPPLFISLITRMRYKRDIKMGRLYTPGGAVIGIVGGGVTFRFF